MSSESPKEAGDLRLEEHLGRVLQAGIRASTVCLAVGLLLGLTAAFPTVSVWLTTAGLIMLMATPIARVLAAVIEYARLHDWTFFTLTAIVLLELCAGIAAALLYHTRL